MDTSNGPGILAQAVRIQGLCYQCLCQIASESGGLGHNADLEGGQGGDQVEAMGEGLGSEVGESGRLGCGKSFQKGESIASSDVEIT